MSKIKFVSKQSNYMLVLKPGIEGNRATGTQPIPGIYVKFQAGVVDVEEERIIKMLREHPGYGTDFLEVKDEDKDPYINERVEIEPGHVMSEIEHGSVGKTVKNVSTRMTPQVKKLIEDEAIKMLPNLLKSNPQILKDIIVTMTKEIQSTETDDKDSVTSVPTAQVIDSSEEIESNKPKTKGTAKKGK